MEFFIHNLDHGVTDDDLKGFLGTLLASVSLHTFEVRKTRKKGCAVLTIADATKADQFFTSYQQDSNALCYRLMGKQIKLNISRNSPDPILVKILQKSESDRILHPRSDRKRNKQGSDTRSKSINLRFRNLSCGRWEVHNSNFQYVVFSTDESCGAVRIDRWSLALISDRTAFVPFAYEVVMNLYDIHSIAVDPVPGPTTVTITLGIAPKIYVYEAGSDLRALLSALLGGDDTKEPTKYRSRELGSMSSRLLATCLVYRLAVENGLDIYEEIKHKSLGAAPLLRQSTLTSIPVHTALEDQITHLDNIFTLHKISYGLRFQLQRLWTNAYLSPHEVSSLLDKILQVRNKSGDEVAVQVVRRISNQIPYAGPGLDPRSLSLERIADSISLAEESILITRTNGTVSMKSSPSGILIHKAIITPTGTYLEGPDEEYSNRVLREYSKYADHFLRITFVEEDGERITFDRESSNEKIFREGFQPALRHGVDIAGRHFNFLGFSHSSLRSQTCWFMAPFARNYEVLTADIVIQKLGDFSQFRSPAKCAARIGQAFSDSHSSIAIKPSYVKHLEDVTRNNYVFSDGVGTFSPKLWSLIRKQSKRSEGPDPTAYQIRYGGAKGMISLDSRLDGYIMCLRPSMIKYEGSKSSNIEICGSASKPLPMRLNQQLIKILEDLGIESNVFEQLQREAIQKLRASASSSQDAYTFLRGSLSDGKTQLPWLLQMLRDLGIDAMQEAFILDILSALIHMELKELKYRARIPVKEAVTLYGIMDETNQLREGEIYCTFSHEHTDIVLKGRVAVTRSPALHPGDLQVAEAVSATGDSPLGELCNCVVFSSQGSRDLPSQLSGGDLDGDLYNIIYDTKLIPQNPMPPADYSRVPSLDIGRQVTAHDMADFFLHFMENDQLGRIATLHRILADQLPDGTKSSECVKLAGLHSTAVDFSKTGIPVNLREIPRSPLYRPDFMAPGPNTKVEKGILIQHINKDDRDGNERRGYRYIESERTLGVLYRSIDEEAFFKALEDDASSVFSKGSQCSVLEQIWKFVQSIYPGQSWRKYLKEAEEIRDCYDSSVIDSMLEYAFRRCNHLSETEVFLGMIVGKHGASTKRQREQAIIMKERFNREVQEVNTWIHHGDNNSNNNNEDHRGTDALERAIACLYIGKTPRNDTTNRVDVQLVSFGWIVAATCLKEVEKFRECC